MVGREIKETIIETYHASSWNKYHTWWDSGNNTLQNKIMQLCQSWTSQQCDNQIDMHMDDDEIEDKNNDTESGTEDE